MAIGNRQLLTPEWAFWHRTTVEGGMLCRVELTSVSGAASSSWTPSDGFSDKRSDSEVVIYRGVARIQPNKDWRARKQEFENQQVVEHAYRIQIGHHTNELDGGVLPTINTQDRIRVIQVSQLGGVPVDTGISDYVYVVRNIVPSSNSWLRTLLCDVVLNG